ncbi:hypothetical protein F5Y18DRAFT_391668 [Xylariaceae sp. FL1019]|nr:hypothetical protein F5Y18DRAFT_391668 [Xylariaceae sp. FL1019]
MRLRQSNQQKRFTFEPDASDLNEAAPEAVSSEDEFIDKAPSEGLIGDGGDEQDQDAHPSGNAGPSFFGAPTNARQRAYQRKQRADQPRCTVGEEVPAYPSDPGQRWTRAYHGPLKRWTRLYELIDWWYGDHPDRRLIIDEFMRIWWPHQLLPPRLSSPAHLRRAQQGWMKENFAADQRLKYRELYECRLVHQLSQQTATIVDKERVFHEFIPQTGGNLKVLLGPPSDQRAYTIQYGESISCSDSGIPIDNGGSDEITIGGWLLDVGGTVVSMAWAPAVGEVDQLLAIAVTPFSDQAFYRNVGDMPQPSDQKQGTVQILRFEAAKDEMDAVRPSGRAPRLAHLLCFSWGRVSKIYWCPIPLTVEDPARLLGVLCGDGKLRILSVRNSSWQDINEVFEEMETPLVTLEPPNEASLEITCFTWINMNRVAAGLSDGSVGVWSVSPPRFLQRHPVHSAAIMEIASGYPSDPWIVATIPIGGFMTMTDLRLPSAEVTYHPSAMVSLQPNLLAWSPLIRGFASIWPSAFAGNPNISFLPLKSFPLCRHLITVDGQPTCIGISACHSYALVGTTDGSVWVFSMLHKLSTYRKTTHKVKIFQHEFSSAISSTDYEVGQTNCRGTSRIVHGFLPRPNLHPVSVKMAETQRQNRKKGKKGKTKDKGKSTARPKRTPGPTEGEGDEEAAMTSGPGPITLNDPQTRITVTAWNPNAEYSWWAAVAMGSGLLRVIDLGVDPRGDDEMPEMKPQDEESADESEADDTMELIEDEHTDGENGHDDDEGDQEQEQSDTEMA